ncbi:PD40 domain-containing protein [soil metagenome]
MTSRLRLVIAAVLTIVLLGGATVYGIIAFTGYQARQNAPSQVDTTTAPADDTGSRIVFRNTATGAGYGLESSVPLADPSGTRAVGTVACDRVYSTTKYSMCLRIDRGVLTTFSATLYDAAWKAKKAWALPGIPSRTRISADSKLVAFTSFVTGESYGTVGFATATQISATDGTDYGNLETFALMIDGTRNTATDRNFWGVTFGSDDNTFYATAATGGHTWLVKGDLAARTLTTVTQGAECPSISPDGTRVAYKKNVSTSATAYWSIAVLDLATGVEKLLPETRSVDDQVDWLDESTLLYGMPRTDSPGDSDIWSISSTGSAEGTRFIQHAWSPSVVRQ